MNLHAIVFAKEQWALVGGRKTGDPVSVEVVDKYIKGGHPVCPNGGEYVYGAVGETPRCTFHGPLPGSDQGGPRYKITTSLREDGYSHEFYAGGPDIVGVVTVIPGYPPPQKLPKTFGNTLTEENAEKALDAQKLFTSFSLSNGVAFATNEIGAHIKVRVERREDGTWRTTGGAPRIELVPTNLNWFVAQNKYMFRIDVRHAQEGEYRAVVDVTMEPDACLVCNLGADHALNYTVKAVKTQDDAERLLVAEALAALDLGKYADADRLCRETLAKNRVNVKRKLDLVDLLLQVAELNGHFGDALVLLYVNTAYAQPHSPWRVKTLVEGYETSNKFQDNESLLKQKASEFIKTYLSDTNPVVRLEDVDLLKDAGGIHGRSER